MPTCGPCDDLGRTETQPHKVQRRGSCGPSPRPAPSSPGTGDTGTDSRDGVDHVQAHLHTAVGVVGLGLGEAGHTVVAVAQDLDAPAVVLLGAKGASGRAPTPLGAGDHRPQGPPRLPSSSLASGGWVAPSCDQGRPGAPTPSPHLPSGLLLQAGRHLPVPPLTRPTPQTLPQPGLSPPWGWHMPPLPSHEGRYVMPPEMCRVPPLAQEGRATRTCSLSPTSPSTELSHLVAPSPDLAP